MPDLRFYNGERARLAVTKANKKKIKALYKQVTKEIQQELKSIQGVNISSVMRKQYLKELQKQIDRALSDVDNQLEGIIKTGMRNTAVGVVTDARAFLSTVGMKVKGAYLNVPQDIVARVATGKVYQSDWSLSKAIWGNSKKIHNDINKIVAKGIAENKSAYAIGKDLEKYVNPSAKKDWAWSKAYPGTNKTIDYNAQRLSRTLTTHAYQQSLVEVCKENPYIAGLRWEASGGPRMCDICEERDGKIYPVDDCPLDHPNGMCTQVAVLDRPLNEIAQDLAQKVSETTISDEDYLAWKEYLEGTSQEAS